MSSKSAGTGADGPDAGLGVGPVASAAVAGASRPIPIPALNVATRASTTTAPMAPSGVPSRPPVRSEPGRDRS